MAASHSRPIGGPSHDFGAFRHSLLLRVDPQDPSPELSAILGHFTHRYGSERPFAAPGDQKFATHQSV
jgi:hypothetical protein